MEVRATIYIYLTATVFQNIGGTAFITASQAAFVNTLVKTLPKNAPQLDPLAVVQTGATDLRKKFAARDVVGIIESYMAGIQVGFAIAIAATGVALLLALCQRWQRINQQAPPTDQDAQLEKSA